MLCWKLQWTLISGAALAGGTPAKGLVSSRWCSHKTYQWNLNYWCLQNWASFHMLIWDSQVDTCPDHTWFQFVWRCSCNLWLGCTTMGEHQVTGLSSGTLSKISWFVPCSSHFFRGSWRKYGTCVPVKKGYVIPCVGYTKILPLYIWCFLCDVYHTINTGTLHMCIWQYILRMYWTPHGREVYCCKLVYWGSQQLTGI